MTVNTRRPHLPSSRAIPPSPSDQEGPKDDTTPRAPALTSAASCALLFLMLFVPTTYQIVKMPLLAVALVACLFSRPPVRVQVGATFTVLGISSFGIFQSVHGAWNANPGAYSQLTVYVLWPLVFLALTSLVRTERQLRGIFRTFVVASLAIGVFGSLYIASQTGLLPALPILSLVNQGQGITYDRGIIEFTLNSLSSLLFLVPFLIALVLTWPKEVKPPVPRVLTYVALALTVGLVVLSGRRALLVVFAATPLLVLVVEPRLLRGRWKRFLRAGFLMAGVGLAVIKVLHLDVAANIRWLSAGFQFDSGVAHANLRTQQFHALVDGWSYHPVFGVGLGGVAETSIRSVETPWAYELSYLALLFHTGLVGVALYAIVVGASFVRTVLLMHARPAMRKWSVPALVGMMSFLIGNATNPYLEKFDGLWILFIPLALLTVGRHASKAADPRPGTASAAPQTAEVHSATPRR